MTRGSREKAFGIFSPVTRHTVTFSVTLCRMNLAHYKKAFGTFSKGMHWRTRPPHHRYCSCYYYLCEWAIYILHSTRSWLLDKMTNPFVNGLRLVLYNNMRILCACVCVCVQPEISGTGGHITTLLTSSWRASPCELHKLLFEPVRHAVWENKPLEVFSQLHAEFPCTHRYTSGYLGQDEFCPLLDLRWNFLEGHTLKDTPTTSRVP